MYRMLHSLANLAPPMELADTNHETDDDINTDGILALELENNNFSRPSTNARPTLKLRLCNWNPSITGLQKNTPSTTSATSTITDVQGTNKYENKRSMNMCRCQTTLKIDVHDLMENLVTFRCRVFEMSMPTPVYSARRCMPQKW